MHRCRVNLRVCNQLRERSRKMSTASALSPSMNGSRVFIDSLQHKALWQTTSYINGKFSADSDSQFDVMNPSNGEIIASCPRQGKHDVDVATAAATAAQQTWKSTTAKQRATLLVKIADLVDEHKEDLARILTLESGKPLAEARGEINYANSFFRLYAEEATRAHGEVLQPNVKGRRMMTIKQPIGPVALITPWNFPSAMITRKLAPALAAGCTSVIKPAELTPLSALALCAIVHEAGVPPGVVNCLTVGREEVIEVGGSMCHHPDLRKLSFTGSTAVGKWLYRESSETVKKLSLELGGNAPFIVFDDADIPIAVTALINAKFRNTGQTCISSNRIFVQAGIYDEFASALADKVKNIKCGDGFNSDNTAGPLINALGLKKVSDQVEDCLALGATVLLGGEPIHELNAKGGTFYKPTILTNVTPSMRPYFEETFGPVASLFRFETEEEVIQLANDTPFGLAAYAMTTNLSRAFRISEALESGMVGINEGAISSDAIPFGGVKQSGIGREGGHWGLDEYLELKYICMGGI
jgi:succinate-semialdehyde dehydrogenase / glutarate-semialdehyde dehydrogenase